MSTLARLVGRSPLSGDPELEGIDLPDVLTAVVPKPVKLQSSARKIAAAISEGRPPPRFDADQLGFWINAADWLIERGELEAAETALHALRAAQPELPWAVSVGDLLERAPPLEPGASDLHDLVRKDVQIAPRPGAETALILFCDRRHRVGMPLPLINRWLTRTGASLIYLRDFQGHCYLNGVASLGVGLEATAAALRGVLEGLGARRAVCLGGSGGGYGALRYAIELGCDAITLGSPVNLEPAFNVYTNYSAFAQQLRAAFPDQELDLRRRIEAAGSPPRALIVYGERNWNERIHAEHMAGAPGAGLYPVAGYSGHTTAAELIRRGELGPMLEDFLEGRPVGQAGAPAS